MIYKLIKMIREIGSTIQNNELSKIKGGCDLGAQVQECDATKGREELPGVPPEKVAAMKAYAMKIKKNSPKMKSERLSRKVAEHFKVKLV